MADKGLVVVTGASGFVGKYVIVELLRAGYHVRGTLRDLNKADEVRAVIARLAGREVTARFGLVHADLLSDENWAGAMAGADALVHVAAVVVGAEPRDSDIVIRPAVEGTERVMRFAHEAGVGRMILTSSIATVGYGHGHRAGRRTYTEADFTNLAGLSQPWAYCLGKTRAEQAAWTFAEARGMALTTIHPGMILGPASDPDTSVSLSLVSGLLDGTTPAMPNLGFSVIDVRDVAAMHLAALEARESAGERYLATGRYLRFSEVADILRAAYPERRITSRPVPDWIMRVVARFGGPARQVINDIGNEKHFDGGKGERLLGRPYISAEDAVLSAAESVIRYGLLKR
jgi:dihydroflavonol-4-reductase